MTIKEWPELYRLRWKRRRLRWRAFKKARELQARSPSHTLPDPSRKGVLVFSVLRNEINRLPVFLDHYRSLGVAHFLMIDNASSDGSAEYLAQQDDVSLWHTDGVYRHSKFGRDWLNALLSRYGHNRWCLTVDIDELLIYAHHQHRNLDELTAWLDQEGRSGFGTLMLELYPDRRLGEHPKDFDPYQEPLRYLTHFDPSPYRSKRQNPLHNLWTQGGVRERVFFKNNPRHSPTLNKLPLVKWTRGYSYVNSTHSILPRRLNHEYGGPDTPGASGVLLHTKFLPEVTQKAAEDLGRQQHFHTPANFKAYYGHIIEGPNMCSQHSLRYRGWEQLADLKLMDAGGF